MKIIKQSETRNEYFNTQIIRSQIKFKYCKVSYYHVANWKKIVDKMFNGLCGPILCLGTRNGREVDLFRTVFRFGKIYNFLVRICEIQRYGWNSIFPLFEKISRSSIKNNDNHTVIGIEINPDASRQDILIGSFDEMPEEWGGRFELIYSNSFDQSQDPYKTAREWNRVLTNNGIAILGFFDLDPTHTDPVGNLTYNDFLDLFPGEMIYYNKFGSNYHDIIIQKKNSSVSIVK